jgi:hypothetical protein
MDKKKNKKNLFFLPLILVDWNFILNYKIQKILSSFDFLVLTIQSYYFSDKIKEKKFLKKI